MPRVLRFRLILLCLCVALAAGAITARLYSLQVENHERFVLRATEQHEQEFSRPARRGALLDRHGRTLAVSLERKSLYVHPQRVEDPDTAAAVLAAAIPVSRSKLARELRSDRSFVFLHRFLDPETQRKVEQLGRRNGDEPARLALGPGQPFDFERETRRKYPHGHVASHVIGFADMDGKGVAGTENRFDDVLQGDPTTFLFLKDARAGLRRQIVRTPLRESADVLLTLDLSLQHLLERELDDALRETGAKAASALILDPKTGQVLAMANRPTIDRNAKRWNENARTNRAIEYFFEPGSTFKIVPMALALEAGVVGLDERIYCHDGLFRTHYGRPIRDVGRNGMLTPRAIMAKSSNIGMVNITRRIDSDALREGIVRFGFGQRTGIELPAESPGSLQAVRDWSGYTHDSLAFGQEIGATALQVASAMATIANLGLRVEPRIGLGTRNADGSMMLFEPGATHRVVSAQTAQQVASMLEDVVEKGSGHSARLPGYRVAGKSGTAQKVDSGEAGYSATDYIASFVGFAPVSDPTLVVLVALDSPRGPHRQGGEVAAPVFAGILAAGLQYLRVPKDAEPPLLAGTAPVREDSATTRGPVTPGQVPDVREMTLREAIATLSAQGYRARVDGSGKVYAQNPQAGTLLAPGGVCDLTARNSG